MSRWMGRCDELYSPSSDSLSLEQIMSTVSIIACSLSYAVKYELTASLMSLELSPEKDCAPSVVRLKSASASSTSFPTDIESACIIRVGGNDRGRQNRMEDRRIHPIVNYGGGCHTVPLLPDDLGRVQNMGVPAHSQTTVASSRRLSSLRREHRGHHVGQQLRALLVARGPANALLRGFSCLPELVRFHGAHPPSALHLRSESLQRPCGAPPDNWLLWNEVEVAARGSRWGGGWIGGCFWGGEG